MMYDAVLVGHGPAAVSAALYLTRAGWNAVLVGGGRSSLLKAEKIENFYGLEHPVSGKELFDRGIAQAKALGIPVEEDEILGLDFGKGCFVARGKRRDYEGQALLLATGAGRKAPDIKGLKEYEGMGVSYCAVCDGFFYHGKEVAVLGDGDYALHEAAELLSLASRVTLLTNGKPVPAGLPQGLMADTRRIRGLSGNMVLERVLFEDGSELLASGLFVAVGIASAADLAKKAGIRTKGQYLVVDETMQTNVPGIYAAGDCTGGILQVAGAVNGGAAAGLSMSRYLKKRRSAAGPELKAAELG